MLAKRVGCAPSTLTDQHGYVAGGCPMPVSRHHGTSSTKGNTAGSIIDSIWDNAGNKAVGPKETNKENAIGCDAVIDPESLSWRELVYNVRGAYDAFRNCALQRDKGAASNGSDFEDRFAEYLIYGELVLIGCEQASMGHNWGTVLYGIVNYPDASLVTDGKSVKRKWNFRS